LRRVGRITSTADEIGTGSLEQRLGEQGDADEVGELARTFDAMLDRLDTSMKSQRRLLSDVSHQLRTPVTVARGHLEVLNRASERPEAAVHETLELVIDELDHMTSLIERLLSLGRAMEPELLTLEPISLREFLPSILDTVRVLAPREYVLRPPPAVTVQVDRQQVRGAILNLVDNAVHATAQGGVVTLGASLDPSGDVRLEVEDSGMGIPAKERAAALERFSRPGARDEGGSGLGLAIARAVAIAHGGSISIDQSPELGGARVAIVLPASSVVQGGA
jgi:signal transduction histidine kinase